MVYQQETNEIGHKPISVLVVEDHPVAADGLVSYLETAADIRVVGVLHRGEEVAKAIENLAPDVIILDLVLDGSLMSGTDVAHMVREEYPHVKLLALSAYFDQWRVYGAVQAGVHGYLLKTSPRKEIIQAIRQVNEGFTIYDPRVMGIVQLYLGGKAAPPDPAQPYYDPKIESLTRQEWNVLKLIARHKSNQEIADELCIVKKTVKTHNHNIYQKLRVTDRNQARVWYFTNRHLCPDAD
jgi:two-component system, NarL family, response regulator LiaR